MFQFQEDKLKGKYKMEYEEEFSKENCTIDIKNDSYKKVLQNGNTRKGKVLEERDEFEKRFVLKDFESNLEVEILNDVEKFSDTIYFRTRKVDEKLDENLMIIYSGKLIKIR